MIWRRPEGTPLRYGLNVTPTGLRTHFALRLPFGICWRFAF